VNAHFLVREREIKKALRKSLFKCKLHADEELFEKSPRRTPDLPFTVIRDILIADQEEPIGEYTFG